MLLDVTPKNEVNDLQEDKALSGLESSLKNLSVGEPVKKEISDLEYGLTKISLRDDSDSDQSETDKVDLDTKDDVKTKEESDDEKEADDGEVKTKAESDDEKEADDGEVKSKEESDDEKDANDGEDAEKSAEEEEEEEESAEKSPAKESTTVIKGEKLRSRGLGSGTQTEMILGPISPGFNFGCGETQVAAPMGHYTSQQMFPSMSPQQGMTPNYYGVPRSPMPGYCDSPSVQGYSDSIYSPLQNSNGGCYDGGFPVEGCSPVGFPLDGSPAAFSVESPVGFSMVGSPVALSQYGIPESPQLYEKEITQQVPLVPNLEELTQTDTTPPNYTPAEVLAVIERVESYPYTRIPEEKVKSIKKNLLKGLEDQDLNTEQLVDILKERKSEMEIMRRINLEQLQITQRKMFGISKETLVEKDQEGDHPCMVVACQNESGNRYYEDLLTIIREVRDMRMCCEVPVCSKTQMCLRCHNSNQTTFYSPLAMINNEGDTLLKAVIRAKKPQLVINFICENLYGYQPDLNRVFSRENADFYNYFKHIYPLLEVMLPSI